MPRQARLDIAGALHHIMVRGHNKTDIFIDNEDKSRFIGRLGQNVMDGQCSVYAWALMNNHAHLLFKSGKLGISAVMRKHGLLRLKRIPKRVGTAYPAASRWRRT